MRVKFFSVFIGIFLLLVTSGCDSDRRKTAREKPKEATLVYIQWDEGIAYTHLAKNVLEQKLNYEVTLLSAELDAAYKTVADGDADAFMESWHPVLHKSYLERYGSRLTDLGVVVDSAKSGLVVPDYMPVDSIRHLQKPEVKENLRSIIMGIERDAGIMQTTQQVLQRYKLPYELRSSSGPAMTAALKRAIENKDWIVVTGWKPHWMFGKWDLKFLKQDQDKKLWTGGAIHIMGSRNIETQKPGLAAFLKNMKLSSGQLYDLMLDIEEKDENTEIADLTEQWMRNHPDVIESWIPDQ